MAWWLRQSLRSRLLWLVLLALTPAIVLHVASTIEKRRLAQQDAEDHLKSQTELAAGQTQIALENAAGFLRGLAELPEIVALDPAEAAAVLDRGHRLFAPFASLSLLDRNGAMVAASPADRPTDRPAASSWFRSCLDGRTTCTLGYAAGTATTPASLLLARPVRDARGAVVGVCSLGLRLDWLEHIFTGIRFPAQSEARLLDATGRILATWPERPERIGQVMPDAKAVPAQTALEDQMTWTAPRQHGVLYCNAAVPVSIDGAPQLQLRLRRPVSAMLAPLDRTLRRDMTLLGLVLILALAATHFFAQFSVLRPTQRLARMAQDMAAGDLSRRSGLGAGRGEIAGLARALDAMADTIEERIRFTQELMDVVPTPLFYKDVEGRYLGCNRAYEQALHPLDAIRGRKAASFAPPAQVAVCADEDHRLLAAPDRPRAYECPLTFRDGTLHDVVIFKSIFRNAAGIPAGIVAVIMDISERIRSERALTASESRYRALLASMGDGFAVVDGQDHVVESNPAFQQMLGYSPAELARLTVQELALDGDAPIIPDEGRPSADDPTASGVYFKQYRHRNGSLLPVSLRRSPYPVQDGNDCRYFVIARDMTRLVVYENDLRAAKEAAETASRAKSDFLAKMSHEIRTPLNAIIGMTELTLATALTPEQRDALETAREASKVLLDVISDILDISRIEARKLELAIEDCDLRRTVATMIRTLRPQAGRKGLALHLRLAPDVPRAVRGDPGRLRQILMNLIGNAIKFTRHGGVTLTVSPAAVTLPSPDVVPLDFRVTDTGIGIPPDRLERIFELFTQADASVGERYGGTGLGLAICRELARLMGGSVRVQSAPGQGSTFTATLVFAPPEAPLQAPVRSDCATAPAYPAIDPSLRPLAILVAEDNPVNVKVATTYLARRGHRTVVAGCGREALETLARESFDLVFMDVEMPEIDGLEATRRLRAGAAGPRNRQVPVYAMTAHVLSDARARCLEAGMTGYLAKPLDFKDLAAILAGISPAAPPAPEPGPEEDATQAPTLDIPAALARLGGDTDLMREIQTDFLHQYPGKLRAIGLCQETENWEEAALAAHSLKNITGAVGAEAARVLAGHLENSLRQADAVTAAELLAALKENLAGVRQALSAWPDRPARPTTVS